MDSKQASQITTALVVVAVGLILLAGQFDTGWALDFGRLWPLIFVVFAIGKFLTRDWRGVVIFGFLSFIFLMHTHRVLTLHHSWPLFIVMGGVCLMFPQQRRRRSEQ